MVINWMNATTNPPQHTHAFRLLKVVGPYNCLLISLFYLKFWKTKNGLREKWGRGAEKIAFKNISDVYVDPSWNGVQFPHITEMKKWFVENGWMDGWIWKMLVYVINSRLLQIVFFTSCTAGDQIPNDDNKEIMTPERKDKVQRQNTYLKWSSDQGLLCENLDDRFVLCQYYWRDWLKTAQ